MFAEIKQKMDVEIPFSTVMPSVTPVCFGTMYTGAQPQVHGIQAYVKPVITIDTIFDAFIRNGKKLLQQERLKNS
jgi:predicted AlkP superfamily pyrophosphatase or phosphodiesterase